MILARRGDLKRVSRETLVTFADSTCKVDFIFHFELKLNSLGTVKPYSLNDVLNIFKNLFIFKLILDLSYKFFKPSFYLDFKTQPKGII